MKVVVESKLYKLGYRKNGNGVWVKRFGSRCRVEIGIDKEIVYRFKDSSLERGVEKRFKSLDELVDSYGMWIGLEEE